LNYPVFLFGSACQSCLIGFSLALYAAAPIVVTLVSRLNGQSLVNLILLQRLR
jgi:hypothetical protein